MGSRILVCGGREWSGDPSVLFGRVIRQGDTIVRGDARGADKTVGDYAEANGYIVEKHPADWNRYGKRAGYVRNQEMLDTGVDMVLALPGGKGTEMMKTLARRAGVLVIEYNFCPKCGDELTQGEQQ